MANENEVRKSVKIIEAIKADLWQMQIGSSVSGYVENEIKPRLEAIQILLSLAEEWLAVKGLPEKKSLIDKAYSVNTGSDNYKIGFNEAINLCRSTIAKDYVHKSKLLTEEAPDGKM